MLEFAGEFETHITIQSGEHTSGDRLARWANLHGFRVHEIVLDRGRTPLQPMLTSRCQGRLSRVLVETESAARMLTLEGFFVSRIKLEAAPSNADVPTTDADAVGHHSRYFEHHVKLLLSAEADLVALTKLAMPHLARLSRNARRERADGQLERFLTQRCYFVGRTSSQERLSKLLKDLREFDYQVLSSEQEFVVYDSQPEVDAGWLDEGESR